MFFDGWQGPLGVVVAGLAAYVSLPMLLRVSGKRTLSKLNAFDFVVTVALGSTLATVLLSSDVAFVEGVTALVLLMGLQFVAWFSALRKGIERLVKSEPTLDYRNGFLDAAMREERIPPVRDKGAAVNRRIAAQVQNGPANSRLAGQLSACTTKAADQRTSPAEPIAESSRPWHFPAP